MGRGASSRQSQIILAKKKKKFLSNAAEIRTFKKKRERSLDELEAGEKRFDEILQRFAVDGDKNIIGGVEKPKAPFRFVKEDSSMRNIETTSRLKPRKPDPLYREVSLAQTKKAEFEAKIIEKNRKEQEHLANITKRKERQKSIAKGLARGQPIMRNKITSLLEKIQHDVMQ